MLIYWECWYARLICLHGTYSLSRLPLPGRNCPACPGKCWPSVWASFQTLPQLISLSSNGEVGGLLFYRPIRVLCVSVATMCVCSERGFCAPAPQPRSLPSPPDSSNSDGVYYSDVYEPETSEYSVPSELPPSYETAASVGRLPLVPVGFAAWLLYYLVLVSVFLESISHSHCHSFSLSLFTSVCVCISC